MKRAAKWLLSLICFPFFLIFWVLYMFVLDPLSWMIQAPSSVWMGARELLKKWFTGKE